MADELEGTAHAKRSGAEKQDERDIREQFTQLLNVLQRLPDTRRAILQGELTEVLLNQTASINTPHGAISFVPFGKGGAKRGLNLLRKQPATIEWIDGFRPNSAFWDVGANVGVYTLYAALRGDMTVVAFEPAAVNYFLLVANCEANRFDQRVQCVLAGLGREKAFATLEVSQFSVGNSFSFHGKPNRPFEGRQSAFIWSMDQLIEEHAFPCPNYIKIDVPGMTADILAGGARTLQRREVRELHIEVDETSSDGAALIQTVERCGFVLTRSDARGIADLTFVRPGT